MNKQRGSEKLKAAWQSRVLTDEAFREITTELEKSKATIEKVNVIGGDKATGVQVLLTYSGDDVPYCGNDLAFWLRWRLKYGSTVKPPKIIINGTPWPDLIRMQLDFGHVADASLGLDLVSEMTELDAVRMGGEMTRLAGLDVTRTGVR